MEWKRFDEDPPEVGRKILILTEFGNVAGPYRSKSRLLSGSHWAYFTHPNRKVTKTIEAWAVVRVDGELCALTYTQSSAEYDCAPGEQVVHLTGTYEVEEEWDG